MNTKQRDVVFQRWSGVIQREARDLASLEQISARALADPDVHDDPTLQSMIRADLEKRRAELQQELQTEQSRAASLRSRADERSLPPEPMSSTADCCLRSGTINILPVRLVEDRVEEPTLLLLMN